MFKPTLAALLAALMIAGVATEVMAKPAPPPPPPCANCGGGGGGNGGPGGGNGDNADAPAPIQACNAALDKLGRVTESEVDSFDEGKVRIVLVCDGAKAGDIDDAQVADLRDDIAGNLLLAGKLRARGFAADDVVGIVISSDGARLFVHKA